MTTMVDLVLCEYEDLSAKLRKLMNYNKNIFMKFNSFALHNGELLYFSQLNLCYFNLSLYL